MLKYVSIPCWLFMSCFFTVSAQQSISFQKHSRFDNLLTGSKFGFELPVYIGRIATSDFEYEGTDAKKPNYIGFSPKITLKNGWGRGIGLGLGLDYATTGYFRANVLLDLDFLFNYAIPMNEEGLIFNPSMFTKFEFTKVLAKIDGSFINEYYLSVNIIKMQFGKIAFEWGITMGIMRDKFPPHFADKGNYYKLSYSIF
jgi:hypothetical protein